MQNLPFRLKLYILGAIVVVIVLVSILLSLFRTKQQPEKQSTYTVYPTNYPSVSQTQQYSVTQTFPLENATDVSVTAAVTVTFSRALSTAEQQQISLTLSPTISGQTQWDSLSQTLSFLPTQNLDNNQLYTVTVTSPTSTTQWSFTTTQLPLNQDVQNSQSRSDKNFADDQKTIHDLYPWIDLLPIQTPSYFAYFDTDTKKIVAKVYPQTSSESEITGIQQDVLTKLKSMGVQTETFPIQWTISRP